MQRSKKNAITRVKKVQTKADQRVQSAKRRVTRWKKKYEESVAACTLAVAKKREVIQANIQLHKQQQCLQRDQREFHRQVEKTVSDAVDLQAEMNIMRNKMVSIQQKKKQLVKNLKRKTTIVVKLQRRWKLRKKRQQIYKRDVQRQVDSLGKSIEQVQQVSSELGSKKKMRKKIADTNRALKREKQKNDKRAKERVYLLLRRKIHELEEESKTKDDEICRLHEQFKEYSMLPDWVREMRVNSKKETGQPPYPVKFKKLSMFMMADGLPASKVNSNVTHTFKSLEEMFGPAENYKLPHETTHRRWRYGIAYAAQVHIGAELTRAAKISRRQNITQDGTPHEGHHVESFVIHAGADLEDRVRVAMIPWTQAGKASTLSAQTAVQFADICQVAYHVFYNKLRPEDRVGLPDPEPLGSFICNITTAVNDHAANELKR